MAHTCANVCTPTHTDTHSQGFMVRLKTEKAHQAIHTLTHRWKRYTLRDAHNWQHYTRRHVGRQTSVILLPFFATCQESETNSLFVCLPSISLTFLSSYIHFCLCACTCIYLRVRVGLAAGRLPSLSFHINMLVIQLCSLFVISL